MIIRDVRIWELRKIEELEKEIFELDAYPYEYLYYLYWNSDYFKVAVDNDEIVGYIIGEIVRDSSHVITIAVVEGYRRQGIGSNLLNSFIEYSIKKGVKRVYLEVSNKRDDAIRFYHKHGFREIGYIHRYYRDGSDAYVMEKNLRMD